MSRVTTRVAVAVGCACILACSVATAQEAAANVPSTLLPHDLSPWGMFESAHIVVKAVMVGLAFASVVTWTFGLAKFLEIASARWKLRSQIVILESAQDLAAAHETVSGQGKLQASVNAALKEIQLSAGSPDVSALRERIANEIERVVAAQAMHAVRGMGVLATIGATAPFVGLFGTVWGIMNSFIGISQQHTTNLAIVAPGIAEALLATALGLGAAIPAVVIYNFLSRQIGSYRALFANGSARVLTLASRDLDFAQSSPKTLPRPRAAE